MANSSYSGPRATSHDSILKPFREAIAQLTKIVDDLEEAVKRLDPTPGRGSSADYPIITTQKEDFDLPDGTWLVILTGGTIKAGEQHDLGTAINGKFQDSGQKYTLTQDDVDWAVANIPGVIDGGGK